jgi:hypothetical protein
MSYETRTSELAPVTDWVNDWDSLDPTRETTWANGQVRGPRNIPVLLHR